MLPVAHTVADSTFRVLYCILILAALFAYADPAAANPDGWGPWEAYRDIEGVGSVTKVSPRSSSWLHWNKDEQGEPAAFTITLNDPKDLDRRYYYCDNQIADVETHDFGLADEHDWRASAGSITGAGVYTPPDSTNDAVTIEVFVLDGDGGYEPEQLHREWNGLLKVFKVGVKVQPAGLEYWEDSPYIKITWTEESDGDALHVLQQSTLLGHNQTSASSSGWNHTHFAWIGLTEPGNAGSSIMGHIKCRPEIKGSGTVYFYGGGNGWGTTTCTVVCSAVGRAGAYLGASYIPAFAKIVTSLLGGGASINASFSGDASIQWIDDSADGWALVNCQDPPHPQLLMPIEWHALADAINVAGTALLKEAEARIGSASAKSEVGILDDSSIMWFGGMVLVIGDLKYATTRPTYQAP